MGAIAMTKQDKIWQAEYDARTLIEAEAISADSTRRKAAVTAAKTMVKKAKAEAKAAEKVAKKKTPSAKKRKK